MCKPNPRAIVALALALIVPAALDARQNYSDAVIVQFQRAVDSYAFQHRQVERRGAATAPLIEGAIFTPQAAAAFRSRLRIARCEPANGADREFIVPRVNSSVDGTNPLPACQAAVLPPLPPELEYRVAGTALLLTDAHLHIVVDILHAAFP